MYTCRNGKRRRAYSYVYRNVECLFLNVMRFFSRFLFAVVVFISFNMLCSMKQDAKILTGNQIKCEMHFRYTHSIHATLILRFPLYALLLRKSFIKRNFSDNFVYPFFILNAFFLFFSCVLFDNVFIYYCYFCHITMFDG